MRGEIYISLKKLSEAKLDFENMLKIDQGNLFATQFIAKLEAEIKA